MKRSGRLPVDPDKTRAWQQRGARRYAQKRRDAQVNVQASASRSGKVKRRRDDGPWRERCLAARGRYCRACPDLTVHRFPDRLEVDHVWPRSQGGPSVVENGLVLCPAHHLAKTESRLLIEWHWLGPDQVAWLADVGWVRWQDDGSPAGRGMKHFAPIGGAGR